jgi:hypothetical protein
MNIRPGRISCIALLSSLLLLALTAPRAQNVNVSPQAQPAQSDPVTAYFDMMDFVRSEAWGRPVATPGPERQRVDELLRGAWGQMDPQLRNAILQFPQTWATVWGNWANTPPEGRERTRAQWRLQLLLPTQLLPPPPGCQTYRAPGDAVVFDYPTGSVVAETTVDDTQFLYLGPPGVQAPWDQILNASTSPPGALLAIAPIDDEMRSVPSHLEAARLIARTAVIPYAPQLREVHALDLAGGGAIITLLGPCGSQGEERFYWVGVVPFGQTHYLAGRLGGPAAQAETLVPVLLNVLTTMEVNPPAPAGAGSGAMGVDLAASIIGNAVVSAGWYASNYGGE